MVRPIVDHVAALTEAFKIAQPAIARVMIEVGRCQDDAGSPHPGHFLQIGPPGRPPAPIAPGMTGGVEPPSVRQTADSDAMWPAASLANTGGALEPDVPANLRPIAGIKSPHL